MSRSSSVLTIATVKYMPHGVATLRSARRHGDYSSFHLFAVDATVESVAELRRALGEDAVWINVFGPNDLGAERSTFLRAFEYYNAVELCCLAKYVGISHVLRDPSVGEICICVDADMRFLGDVRETVDAMGDNAVLLTPHLLGPSRDDMEHDIMMHGWMNAGFVAFRQGHQRTPAVLEWLIDRISRRGFLAPQFGLSADQTWVSGLPILFRDLTYISRHPGLNVGCWNVDERPLARAGDTILAGGCPLLVFHFSGFEPARATRLSKYSEIVVTPGSPLDDVCRLYNSEFDAVAGLQPAVNDLARIPCSTEPLIERIRVGSARNGVDILRPTMRPGVFARLGGKFDSLTRKTMPWVRA